jgi:hypothetical protein
MVKGGDAECREGGEHEHVDAACSSEPPAMCSPTRSERAGRANQRFGGYGFVSWPPGSDAAIGWFGSLDHHSGNASADAAPFGLSEVAIWGPKGRRMVLEGRGLALEVGDAQPENGWRGHPRDHGDRRALRRARRGRRPLPDRDPCVCGVVWQLSGTDAAERTVPAVRLLAVAFAALATCRLSPTRPTSSIRMLGQTRVAPARRARCPSYHVPFLFLMMLQPAGGLVFVGTVQVRVTVPSSLRLIVNLLPLIAEVTVSV